MSKIKKSTVRVQKTELLDQRKLRPIARRYGISPLSVRELQLGFPEEILKRAADLLIADGLVTVVTIKLRSPQARVDSLNITTELNEPLALSAESDVENLDTDSNDTTGDEKKDEENLDA